MLSSLVFPKVAHESSNTMWHHHTNVQNQAAKVRQLMQWKWGKVRRRWSHWLTLHSNRIISMMIKITFAKLFFHVFRRVSYCHLFNCQSHSNVYTPFLSFFLHSTLFWFCHLILCWDGFQFCFGCFCFPLIFFCNRITIKCYCVVVSHNKQN